jgi:hypothetical protein
MTSIEWLIDRLKSIPLAKDKDEFTNGDIMDIVKQAKEMHKQEIIDAWEMGRFNIDDVGLGQEYYQETFNKNNI